MSTDLLSASVSATTQRRYRVALTAFLAWARRYLRSPTFPSTPFQSPYESLDAVLSAYITAQHASNDSRGRRQHCINVRAAIQLWLPNSSHNLQCSQRMLIGWDRLRPSTQRPPCPHSLCLVLIRRLIAANQYHMALIVWLCFDALLRINEALSIRIDDISLPTSTGAGGIRLPSTKTGRNQSVVIDNPHLAKLLRFVIRTRSGHSDDRLFPRRFTSSAVAQRLNLLCRTLNVTNLCLTAHSLRHGGASEAHIRGVPMSDIIHRGRWRSQRTAERYIQAGRSLLLGFHLPNAVAEEGRFLMSHQAVLVDALQ